MIKKVLLSALFPVLLTVIIAFIRPNSIASAKFMIQSTPTPCTYDCGTPKPICTQQAEDTPTWIYTPLGGKTYTPTPSFEPKSCAAGQVIGTYNTGEFFTYHKPSDVAGGQGFIVWYSNSDYPAAVWNGYNDYTCPLTGPSGSGWCEGEYGISNHPAIVASDNSLITVHQGPATFAYGVECGGTPTPTPFQGTITPTITITPTPTLVTGFYFRKPNQSYVLKSVGMTGYGLGNLVDIPLTDNGNPAVGIAGKSERNGVGTSAAQCYSYLKQGISTWNQQATDGTTYKYLLDTTNYAYLLDPYKAWVEANIPNMTGMYFVSSTLGNRNNWGPFYSYWGSGTASYTYTCTFDVWIIYYGGIPYPTPTVTLTPTWGPSPTVSPTVTPTPDGSCVIPDDDPGTIFVPPTPGNRDCFPIVPPVDIDVQSFSIPFTAITFPGISFHSPDVELCITWYSYTIKLLGYDFSPLIAALVALIGLGEIVAVFR